ncbi:MAG TPA: hypothetical protein PL051_03035 [Candidatus Saccharibacteria bacterium]|nr:hypothetical protein [Candidatus Saccharibacteria bacterium]
MEDPDSINPTPISDDLMPGAKLSPYDLLIRQSRKMGKFATRGFDVTKEFLKQDVSALHPDKLLFGQEIRTEMAPVLDSKEKLNKIVEKTHQILAYARTVVLPSNVFPDTVIVDRTKITITKRTFFWSSEVISIRIEDVLNVTASTGPFFGTLTISSRVMNSTDHYEINALFRRDALYLKQIIQGYVIAQHNQIQTSHLDKNELIKTLLEIGRDSDY